MKLLGPEFLYEALASPLGIVLKVDDLERARQQLYVFKREANDPALQNLALKPDPEDTTKLFLVKKAKPDAP